MSLNVSGDGYSALTAPPTTGLGWCQSLHRQAMDRLERKRPLLRDLQDFWAPYSADVDQRGTSSRDDVTPDILDDSVFFTRMTLASGMFWGITNPSRQWSQWTLGDPTIGESEAVKQWMYTTNARRMQVLAGSNFYDIMRWVYEEWPTFGTAVVLIEEDERDIVRYQPWPIGSYSIIDNARGEAVGLARTFPMTVRQVVERFATLPNGKPDLSKLSPNVRKAVESAEWETSIKVAQLIAPNDAYRPDSDLPRDYAYGSWFWEAEQAGKNGVGLLASEGYREFPAMVFRWGRVAGDVFGTNQPGLLSLPTNKTLQAMESDLLLAIEKQAKPPLVVPEDKAVSLLPGARNVFTSNSRVQAGPLHTVEAMAIERIAQAQAERRGRLEAVWYTRLMLSFSLDQRVQPKTAAEVAEIGQEKYLVLGPVLESASQEFRRGSEREFAIMSRRGLLPEPPPELEGQVLPLEFTSILAVAQKAVGLAGVERFGMWAAEFANGMGDPTALDGVDADALVREVAQRSALPPAVTRSPEQIAQRRRARAEAQAQQARAEQAVLEAKAVKDLGTTPLNDNSALSGLLNAGPSPDAVGV